MGRTCSMHGENRNVYSVLVVRSEGKRPLEDLQVVGVKY
jgi:hypothetical protein